MNSVAVPTITTSLLELVSVLQEQFEDEVLQIAALQVLCEDSDARMLVDSGKLFRVRIGN